MIWLGLGGVGYLVGFGDEAGLGWRFGCDWRFGWIGDFVELQI